MGRRLVDACWEAARELEINSVFTLTYVADFFEKCGYHRIDKADLPHKIWNECVRCPLFPNCNEIALIRSFHPESATLVGARRRQASRSRSRSDVTGRPGPRASRSWTIRGRRLAVALATLALMLATEPRLAIVWDEGYTLGREARLRLWFRALRDPAAVRRDLAAAAPIELVQQVGAPPPRPDQIDTRAELLFDPRVLAWFWPFAREEPHGHPPFYALVGPGRRRARPRLGRPAPRPARADARLQPDGRGAVRLRRPPLGAWPGVLAAGAWVFQPQPLRPRPLRHATTPCCQPLGRRDPGVRRGGRATGTSSRVAARPRWGWVVVFGLLAGCAADTKLTGWFLPLPFLAWTVLLPRVVAGALTLLVGGVRGDRDALRPQSPLVDRADRGRRAVPPVEPDAGPRRSRSRSCSWAGSTRRPTSRSPGTTPWSGRCSSRRSGSWRWRWSGVVRALRRAAERAVRPAGGGALGVPAGPPRPAAHARTRRRPPVPAGLRRAWPWSRAWGRRRSCERFGRWGKALVVAAPGRGGGQRRADDARPALVLQPARRRPARRRPRWGWSRPTTGTPSPTTRSTGSTAHTGRRRRSGSRPIPTSWLYLRADRPA